MYLIARKAFFLEAELLWEPCDGLLDRPGILFEGEKQRLVSDFLPE